LVALARLANNILTYGTYFGPKPSGDADVSANASNGASPLPNQQAEQVGSDVMKGLFSVVGEYGKMKAEISSLIHSKHPKNDAIENASQAKTTTTTASNETSTTNAPTQHEGTSNAADVQQSVKPSPAKETTTNKPTTTAEDQKAKTASDDEKSHTATSLTDPEKKPTADHNEDQKLVNSLKNIEDIFEPLIETTEQLTEGIGEVENEFEQAIEEEMNDHDAANDTDEDDDNLDKKTYWFPKKK
jgi:cytoskeletal protein RodZ